MVNILVVEDNPLIANQLKRMICNVHKEAEVFITGYACEALELMQQKQIALFLLDVGLYDYSGLELGKKIRQLEGYELVPIVFITATPSRELEAFRHIHCYDYILKPFKEERLREVLVTLLEKGFTQPLENLELKLVQKHFTLVLKQHKIIYIEAQNKKLVFVTQEEVVDISTYTLKEIEEKLGPHFIRCHRGFIINQEYIKRIDKSHSCIELKDTYGILPIGEKYKQNLKGRWF